MAAIGVRSSLVTSLGLWVDEAESSINALSILEHGYPTDEYAGIPVFENMLIRPWPDHPEYEFKDISYSEKGMAVYHGWLPLYSIAASFKMFGTEPAKPEIGWRIDADADTMRRRTLAARLPSLFFAAAFLVLLFLAARRLCGDDAALPVLLIASLSSSVILPTLFARYYALMLALSAAGALTLWQTLRHGRTRDYAAHAVVLALLFYTHMLAFAGLMALTTAMTLFHWGFGKQLLRWLAAMAAVVACACPWLLATGYVPHLAHMPSGLGFVRLPDDLLHYVSDRKAYSAFFSAGALWLALVWMRHGAALPRRLAEPWQRHRLQYTMLLAWMAIGAAGYFLFSPAASLFPQRLSLMLFVPAFLFMGMTLADAARTISQSRSVYLTPALALAFLAAGGLLKIPDRDLDVFPRLERIFAAVNQIGLAPDAKVYASPLISHILTFYSGKPIQSLAPVRKSFLDSYPGEVLYIDQRSPWELTSPKIEEIQEAARELSAQPSANEVAELRAVLELRFAREQTHASGIAVEPPLETLTPLGEAVMQKTRWRAEYLAELEEAKWESQGFPFARGYRIRTAADFWQTFFYRLVDPASRSGGRLNAAERLRSGRAFFPRGVDCVLIYAPAPPVPARESTGGGSASGNASATASP